MFARALVPLCPKHTWRVFNENAGGSRRGVHGEARIEMSEALCCGGAPTLQMLFVVDCEYWMHQAHYSYFKMNRLRWWFCTGLKCRSGILETRPKNHAWASEAGLVNPVLPWRPCTSHLVQTLTVTVSNVRNPGEGTDWSQSPLRIMSLLLFDYAKLLNLWAFSSFIAKMELNLGSSEEEETQVQITVNLNKRYIFNGWVLKSVCKTIYIVDIFMGANIHKKYSFSLNSKLTFV